MKELIIFDLRRRFANKATIILNILLFVMILCGFHIDYILNEEITIDTVLVDSSLMEDIDIFITLSDEHLTYKASDRENKENEAILHFDENWQIISKYELDQYTKERIINDINKVVITKYKNTHQFLEGFIDEFVKINPEVIIKNEEIIDGSIVIILAISFFLIINYGCTSSSEIIIEKSTGVLNIILTNIEAKKHLIAKMIVSYLIVIVQLVVVIVQFLMSYLIRFIQDGCLGLQNFIAKIVVISTENTVTVELTMAKIFLIVLIMFLNLLLIQLIIILVTSKYTNGQQMASFQGLLYVGLLIIYYLTMIFSEDLINSQAINLLAYLPLFSMVFIPQKIISSNINLLSVFLVLIMLIAMITILVVKGSDYYKRNLLIQK